MSYGIFFEHYDHKLTPSIPDSQLSLVGGTQSFMTLFLSVWVGRLLDRRRHYYVLAVGFVLMIVGLFSLSFINQLKLEREKFGIMWFTQGFLTSVGMSCFFMYGLHNTIAVRFLLKGASCSCQDGLNFSVVPQQAPPGHRNGFVRCRHRYDFV